MTDKKEYAAVKLLISNGECIVVEESRVTCYRPIAFEQAANQLGREYMNGGKNGVS